MRKVLDRALARVTTTVFGVAHAQVPYPMYPYNQAQAQAYYAAAMRGMPQAAGMQGMQPNVQANMQNMQNMQLAAQRQQQQQFYQLQQLQYSMQHKPGTQQQQQQGR